MNHYVVFDLDDTLGCFPAMSRDMFESRLRNPQLQENARFNMLMEVNPYVRPQIVSILRFLQRTKQVRPLSVVLYRFWRGCRFKPKLLGEPELM